MTGVPRALQTEGNSFIPPGANPNWQKPFIAPRGGGSPKKPLNGNPVHPSNNIGKHTTDPMRLAEWL
jgi:hypothetical protein